MLFIIKCFFQHWKIWMRNFSLHFFAQIANRTHRLKNHSQSVFYILYSNSYYFTFIHEYSCTLWWIQFRKHTLNLFGNFEILALSKSYGATEFKAHIRMLSTGFKVWLIISIFIYHITCILKNTHLKILCEFNSFFKIHDLFTFSKEIKERRQIQRKQKNAICKLPSRISYESVMQNRCRRNSNDIFICEFNLSALLYVIFVYDVLDYFCLLSLLRLCIIFSFFIGLNLNSCIFFFIVQCSKVLLWF